MANTPVGDGRGYVQFSLRTMLLVMLSVGIVLAPAHWYGGYYLFTVALTALLISSCVAAYAHDLKLLAIGVAFGGMLLGAVLAAPVFFLFAMLNALGIVSCIIFGSRPRSVAIVLTGLAVFLYGFLIVSGLEKVRELASLEKQYVFESLETRLAFERNAVIQSPQATEEPSTPQLSNLVLTNLQHQESQMDWNRREWHLERLHERTYQQFAFAAGFGVGRMGEVSAESLELAPIPVVELPLIMAEVSETPQSMELEETHRLATNDFIAIERMGYVRSRSAVAGFGSHGFTTFVEWTREKPSAAVVWQLVRLELVSLLRHPDPRVYVSDKLPMMEAIDEAPTRDLTAFEANALPKLRHDLDTATEIGEDRIQMLGAVRADNNCLECHDGPRGKLLGAFSYELIPITAYKRDEVPVGDFSMTELKLVPW